MKTLSLSILILAIAIGYVGFSIPHQPVPVVAEAELVTKPAELLEWEDKRVQEFLDYQEDYWYPIDDWIDTPASEIEEFEPVSL